MYGICFWNFTGAGGVGEKEAEEEEICHCITVGCA